MSLNWPGVDARKAPEVQQMYSLGFPVSEIRTKIRQEFERHRYVEQLPVVDALIMRSHMEFQVSRKLRGASWTWRKNGSGLKPVIANEGLAMEDPKS